MDTHTHTQVCIHAPTSLLMQVAMPTRPTVAIGFEPVQVMYA